MTLGKDKFLFYNVDHQSTHTHYHGLKGLAVLPEKYGHKYGKL